MLRRYWAVTVCVALAGCGHGHGDTPDAAAADSGVSIDGAVADAPSSHGNVQVTLIDPTKTTMTPSVGATVVFIDAQRTQVVQTDASGQASADVVAGASVTTIQVFGAQTTVNTVFGTQPGDEITIGVPALDKTDAGSFTVKFNPVPQPSNMNFTIHGPCGDVSSATSPAVLTMQKYCEPTNFEILLEGFLNGAPAYADLANVPYVAGGSATLPDLTADPQFTGSFSNISPKISSIAFGRISGGGDHYVTDNAVTSASLTLSVNGAVGATATMFATFFRPGYGDSDVTRQELPTATSVAFDPSATLLGWVGPATYDPSSRTIVVPVLPDGTSNAAPDMFTVVTDYGGGPGKIVQWRFFAGSPGNITLPILPPAAGVPDPASTPYLAAQSIELDTVHGYDDARQIPTTLVDEAGAGSLPPGAKVLRVAHSLATM